MTCILQKFRRRKCLCSGEASWVDLLRMARLLPLPRQPRFPQYSPVGELTPTSFTTGACARGPNVGITRNMKDFPRVTQVLAMLIQAIDPEHRFSSCTLSLNMGASVHRDSHNARGSSNLLIPCSSFQGRRYLASERQRKYTTRTSWALWQYHGCNVTNTFQPAFSSMPLMPWHGNRLVLVAFHVSSPFQSTSRRSGGSDGLRL